MANLQNFSSYIGEETEETASKAEVLSILEELYKGAENDVEEILIDTLMECIEYDYLNEEGYDCVVDAVLEISEDEVDEEKETPVEEEYKRVVRDGHKIRKKVCKPGYKAEGTRCVKMSQKERIQRSKTAKRVARKLKGKRKQISRKIRRTRKRFNV